MIGKLVKQKIFGELFSEPEDEREIPYRYGIVLSEVKGFVLCKSDGKDSNLDYYMVLWQPTPLFPVGNVQNQRPYTCLANKESLIIVYEGEKS